MRPGKKKCVVPNCDRRNSVCFPINEQNQLLWLYKIKNNDNWVYSKMNETQYICTSHFKPKELELGYENMPKNTLPTLNISKRSRCRTNLNVSTTILKDVTYMKELNINLYPMCCACLRNDECTSICKKWDISSESNKLIADVIKEILGKEISLYDIPLTICRTCLHELHSVYKFRERMVKSYEVMKRCFTEKGVENEKHDKLVTGHENEGELVDIGACQDTTTKIDASGMDIASMHIRNEITKHISNIIDSVILPNIRQNGCNLSSEYIAENGVELFRTLMKKFNQKPNRCVSTQTTETTSISRMTPEVENKANKMPIIVLDNDDVEQSTTPELTISSVNSVISSTNKPNNFGIIYPTKPSLESKSRLTETRSTVSSTVQNKKHLPNLGSTVSVSSVEKVHRSNNSNSIKRNSDLSKSGPQIKRLRMDGVELTPLAVPTSKKLKLGSVINSNEKLDTTKILSNDNKNPSSSQAIYSANKSTVKSVMCNQQFGNTLILPKPSNNPSILITDIDKQQITQPTLDINLYKDTINGLPSMNLYNPAFYVITANPTLNTEPTVPFAGNAVLQTSQPYECLNSGNNDDWTTCERFGSNFLCQQPQKENASQFTYPPTSMRVKSWPQNQPECFLGVVNTNNTKSGVKTAPSTLSNCSVPTVNNHPDVEDYLSQNFIPVGKPNASVENSIRGHELPKILKVQSMSMENCDSRIKVRNISELR